jgi:hypothetical protein
MNLTISLDEAQAGQLQRQAATRQMAPEELAQSILHEALGKLAEEEQWNVLNRRRVELIRKSRTSGLTASEEEDLRRLQDAVDRKLEPIDQQLLAQARQFQHLAEQLTDEPRP